MPGKRLSVVVTRRLPDVVETRLCELFSVTLRDDDKPMSREALAEAMKTADVLVSTITDQIDAALLAGAGENLRLIAQYGAGVDNIDVSTARQRGIQVSNTPGVTTDDTADMALALMLAQARKLNRTIGRISPARLADEGHAYRPFDRRHTPNSSSPPLKSARCQ